MNCCYYFGTFNPIHTGHLQIAQAALSQFCRPRGIDAVTFVPAGMPPHRHGHSDLLGVRDRLKMVRLATASNPGFRVSDVEMYLSGPTYTVEVLEVLHAREIAEGWKIPFIIGADAFAHLHTWHRAERLAEIALFLQAPRPGCEPASRVQPGDRTLQAETFALDMPGMEISSTWLRGQIAAGEALRYMLPEPVRRFILENRLYGAPE